MNNFLYIYNRHQANFFIQMGMKVLEFNKGKKDDYYVKFLKDETSTRIYKEWLTVKDTIKK